MLQAGGQAAVPRTSPPADVSSQDVYHGTAPAEHSAAPQPQEATAPKVAGVRGAEAALGNVPGLQRPVQQMAPPRNDAGDIVHPPERQAQIVSAREASEAAQKAAAKAAATAQQAEDALVRAMSLRDAAVAEAAQLQAVANDKAAAAQAIQEHAEALTAAEAAFDAAVASATAA